MQPLDVIFVLLACLSVARVEHLVASDVWIVFGGPKWKRLVRRMHRGTQADVARMWPAYQQTGGGKLPFLFFGIKSYRLYNWSHTARQVSWRANALWVTRFIWRYYTFAPAMSCLVIIFSLVPHELSAITKTALLAVAFATVAGMLAVAAEAILAALVLDSWAVLYHRWPKPGREQSALREFLVMMGCIVLTLLAVFALFLFVGARFHAYPGFVSKSPGAELREAASLAFPAFFSDAFAPGIGNLAFFASIAATICYLAYILFLLLVGSRLWK
jgi:hypothetical protein